MDEQAPGSVRLGLGLGRRVGSAAQTGPGWRSALCRRKAYRRDWERTAFSCSLGKKDVLMVISVSRACFSCSQSCQSGQWIKEEHLSCRERKPMSGELKRIKFYFHGYKKIHSDSGALGQLQALTARHPPATCGPSQSATKGREAPGFQAPDQREHGNGEKGPRTPGEP